MSRVQEPPSSSFIAREMGEEMADEIERDVRARDFSAAMRRLRADLAYESIMLDKQGTVVGRELKMYMRKKWGYCTTCPDAPMQLYEHVDSVLNPVWLARGPRTAEKEAYKGICLVCHPSAKKDEETSRDWMEKAENGELDFSIPCVIDIGNRKLVDLPNKRKPSPSTLTSAITSPVKSAVASYAVQDTSHRMFASPKPKGLSRLFRSSKSYRRDSENLRKFFHGLQDPEKESALEPEKIKFRQSPWSPTPTPYKDQKKSIRRRTPRNPWQMPVEKLENAHDTMYETMLCKEEVFSKKKNIDSVKDNLDSIFAAAQYHNDVAKASILLETVGLDPVFEPVDPKAWRGQNEENKSLAERKETRDDTPSTDFSGDICVGTLYDEDRHVQLPKYESSTARSPLRSVLRSSLDQSVSNGDNSSGQVRAQRSDRRVRFADEQSKENLIPGVLTDINNKIEQRGEGMPCLIEQSEEVPVNQSSRIEHGCDSFPFEERPVHIEKREEFEDWQSPSKCAPRSLNFDEAIDERKQAPDDTWYVEHGVDRHSNLAFASKGVERKEYSTIEMDFDGEHGAQLSTRFFGHDEVVCENVAKKQDGSEELRATEVISNIKSMIEDVSSNVSIGSDAAEAGFELVISMISSAMRDHPNEANIQAFCMREITKICEMDGRLKLLVAGSGLFDVIADAMTTLYDDNECQKAGAAAICSISEVHTHIK